MTTQSTRRQPVGPGPWLLVASLLCTAAVRGQVSARHGDDPNVFHDSMILEAPFLPAVPGNLAKMADWYYPIDYVNLRRFRCDEIQFIYFASRIKKPEKDGKIRVEMKITLYNPRQNTDKQVDLLLEAHNDQQVISSVKRSIKVEESDSVTRELSLVVAVADLKADPVTQLRITVHTRNI